ncbi:MAG: hypothetical protein OXI35_10020 [Gemmatimonadota bacterium]|nr:hypothetical protein [Gemmatimonadota bacterium]
MTSNTATVREHARYGAATQQKYEPHHCEQAAAIVRRVADEYRL